MKFIKITALEKEMLIEGYKNHPSHTVRRRFQGILLNSQGKQAKELASIYEVRTRTIYDWMNKWNKHGVLGILTKPGQGRPTILSSNNKELVDLIKKNIGACPKLTKNL